MNSYRKFTEFSGCAYDKNQCLQKACMFPNISTVNVLATFKTLSIFTFVKKKLYSTPKIHNYVYNK